MCLLALRPAGAVERLTLSTRTTHIVGPHTVHVELDTGDLEVRAPQCKGWLVGDTHGAHNLDSVVSICEADKHAARPRGGVAMCIPPLYGTAFSSQQVLRHLAHHRRLGVNHTFLYVAEGAWFGRREFEDVGGLTLLHVPWTTLHPTHQRGQLWQINDCLHRAAARGVGWALGIDLDECALI